MDCCCRRQCSRSAASAVAAAPAAAAVNAQAQSQPTTKQRRARWIGIYGRRQDPPGKRRAANVEEHFLRGTTDFAKAAALLDLNAVESMLAAGTSDVDTGDVLDQTPLILLSRNRYSEADVPRAVEVIRRLIKAGARVTDTGRLKRDQYGDAMLHLAAMAAGTMDLPSCKRFLRRYLAGGAPKVCERKVQEFWQHGVALGDIEWPGGYVRDIDSAWREPHQEE